MYPSEKHAFFKDFLRSLWDPLETVLGPFWVQFGKALEAKIDANIDPDENVKIMFRLRENQNMKVEHQKIFTALEKKDVNLSERVLREHLAKLMTYVAPLEKDHPEYFLLK